MSGAGRWDKVYGTKGGDALSWFEADPVASRRLISGYCEPGAAVDVGAGVSHLVDCLIGAGYAPVTLVDLSGVGLDAALARLEKEAPVETFVGSITDWSPTRAYALWHDRAAFHFLTDVEDRAGYVAVLDKALAPGGVAVIATFAEDGPERCSGLPVRRYAPEELAQELDRHAHGRFSPVAEARHTHVTPGGVEQRFQYSVFRKAIA